MVHKITDKCMDIYVTIIIPRLTQSTHFRFLKSDQTEYNMHALAYILGCH